MSGSGSRCCAWVTLATNDTYCLGALVLGHSLRNIQTRHQLAVIITPQVSPAMREQLAKVFDLIHTVDVVDSQDAANLALLQRPDLGVTFTKIHCWTLTQYSKCVFLDADTLVMQNCDELMERDELSAAPDPGWPDCFNSGVFVFVPSEETFKQLIQFASTHGSFDGGDQGLLNMYFNDWPTTDIRKHLSFLYNMCSTSTYTYLPALKYYGANIKIVHFIGSNKPWLLGPSGAGMSQFTQAWWDIFQSSVVQHLSKEMSGLAGALGSKEKSVIEEQWRKQNWEQGNIDFTGKDSFEHIWQKIMSAVNKPKAESPKPAKQTEVPKEIASQAIPEKEKADIPEPVGKEAAPELKKPAAVSVPPTEEKTVSTPESKGTSVLQECLAVTDKSEAPKLPESLTLAAAVLSAPASPALPTEPSKPETSEIAQILKSVGIVSIPSNEKSAPPQEKAPQEPKPPHSQESGELPKIEDILKGLEQTILLAELHSAQDLPTEVPQVPLDSVKTLPQTTVPQKQMVPPPLEVAKADAPLPEIPKTEGNKTEKAPEIQAHKVPAPGVQPEQHQVPTFQTEAPKTIQPEKPKTESSISVTPKPESLTTEVIKPTTPISENLIPGAPLTEASKPVAPPAETPKSVISPAQDTKPVAPPVIPPNEVAKGVIPPAETPKLAGPPVESPKPTIPPPEAPKPIATPTEAPKPVAPLSEAPKPVVPPIEAPKPVVPPTEAPKPVAPLSEAPKPVVPPTEAPKPVVPPIEAPKPVVPPTEAPKPVVPPTEAPKPVVPPTEAPKPVVPPTEAPKPVVPPNEAPKPVAPLSEVLKAVSPLPEAPKPVVSPNEAPQPVAPPTEVPKTVAPPAEAPKPVAPPTEASKTVLPLAEAQKPVLPATEAAKTGTLVTDAPKPVVPSNETPESVVPPAEVPKPETTAKDKSPSLTDAPKSETGKNETLVESTIGALKAQGDELSPKQTKDSAVPASGPPIEGDTSTKTPETVPSAPQEKKDTPAIEQTADQKPVKQQAPQPPPKNGKQKKGQQPEPTTVHPLAEIPTQPELSKELLTSSQDPTSPESQTKQPEVQPGTPTVTAPTPPVTPLDSSKLEDPLTSQIKSEEAELSGGASSGADMPVPPKRKGKGNEKQTQKPQNGGGKSKGKK